jgi:phage-related tail protein
MTEASNIPNRVDRLENEVIDIKVAISALISTTEIHQRNIETMNRNIETMNRNMEAMFQIMTQSLQRMEIMESDIREIQSDIRGFQTENRRILDILQQRNTDDT